MVKFTIKELLAGEVDLDTVNLTDIKGFCMANGLEEYEVTSEKPKRDMLNEIAELLDSSAGMTVKEYADANGMKVAQVLEITGLTHWKNKLGVKEVALLNNPAPAVTETSTAGESVPTKKENHAAKSGYLERRAGQIQAAKARVGQVKGATKFIAEQYAHVPEGKLPGRIQRNIDAQKGGN